ncbi:MULTISPECIES: class I SAM-dependent methyltransferase [Gemella]|uniref:class I SAM-dependent methyltransferase n=1 Tax=Gemella TaxID=1378 RepID=UPI001E591F69|nr:MULTISPECIES: class I SAM-dependent methyltransferase [Gemella]
MRKLSELEELFFKIDRKTEENRSNNTYFESLINYLSLEKDEDYFEIVDNYSKETIRKAYQFLLLKSLKELNDPSYSITPEIITMYVSHLIECIFGEKSISVSDFASGSGNFLINIAALSNGEKRLTSIDVDNNYVKLQQNIFNLLETNVDIINQDVLKPLDIKKQDIIVSDVPFGYYADIDNSLNYKLCSNNGYSLNSLLFIEQTVNYLKDDGIGILVVSRKVLELDNKFKKFLEKDINLNAVITLPVEMFKTDEQVKVIILITKKEQKLLPKQVFLAEIPSYQNKKQYSNFIEEFKKWLKER